LLKSYKKNIPGFVSELTLKVAFVSSSERAVIPTLLPGN